jgi:hypothetical protein
MRTTFLYSNFGPHLQQKREGTTRDSPDEFELFAARRDADDGGGGSGGDAGAWTVAR